MGGLFFQASPLFRLLSMKEITVLENLHKHASLLPPPLFMINEIRVAFAHRFKDVIAANCLSLPKLEVALFDVCFNMDSLKVMELSFLCLGEKTYLIGNVDDKEMEKIEREVEREARREKSGLKTEFHDPRRQ